jgi:hypothetical protein
MVDFLAKNVIRIGSGIIIVGAVTVLANGMLPVASHHSLSTAATCTASASAVGATMTITGTGYAPGNNYVAQVTWPTGGTGNFPVTANSSGNWSLSTYAWWAGTYTVNVETLKATHMATCSDTVS